ncbi:glycoside hydrolase family 3 N-terminal domain-containing protein [Mycolicibacterium mengxianglii]|uniref:glycoside hydrolase family 3 N-terminal domain-containing protein n=1 Tax=Mycolicibacterium mengxianglii TaxID=2736649 RepID=UPI0018EF03B8|nr:glycoside hydrolase family 3 N-terminal domain-containing protein [Mycolicibacterium mengxianglii]
MPNTRALTRTLVSLAALPAMLAACTSVAEAPPSSSAAAPSPQQGVTNTPLSNPLPAAPAPAACGDLQGQIAVMSTRDKLAQLLMVGVRDGADAQAVVADQHVGGIFIGSWTDRSMLNAGLSNELNSVSGPFPVAVSVDEEGGRVQRLSSLIGSQPSAKSLAETSTPEQVHQIALDRGRAMRALGITVDFAPVVDVVTTAGDDSVIGDRSFGSDPAVVTEFAGAYARGLREAGVLPVLKHFPGHGSGSGDSHTGAVTTPPIDQLQASDLVPYRTLTTQSPVAVMVGHLEVPGLTGADPASLSPAAYQLLRSGGYGGPPFGGPVFTDDLSSMAAITDRYGVPEAVLKALQAGADVALWVSTSQVPAVLDRLEQAVADGELAMSAVDASVLRIAQVKGANPRCGG